MPSMKSTKLPVTQRMNGSVIRYVGLFRVFRVLTGALG